MENVNIKYFVPSELLGSSTAERRGIVNIPIDWTTYCNTYYLGYYLDNLRRLYGRPIVITSGYRSPALNDAVGGVKNSRHLQGLAVDIRCLHNADYETLRNIIGSDCRFIKYYPNRHYIHVDFTCEFLQTFFNQNSTNNEK